MHPGSGTQPALRVVFESLLLGWAEGDLRLAMGRVRLPELDGTTAHRAFIAHWLGAMQR
jgi:hypothetical protein